LSAASRLSLFRQRIPTVFIPWWIYYETSSIVEILEGIIPYKTITTAKKRN